MPFGTSLASISQVHHCSPTVVAVPIEFPISPLDLSAIQRDISTSGALPTSAAMIGFDSPSTATTPP